MTKQEFLTIPKQYVFLSDGINDNGYGFLEYKRTENAIIERELIPLKNNTNRLISVSALFVYSGKLYEKINNKWILKNNNCMTIDS